MEFGKEVRYGGGSHICEKCGWTVFGSKIHRCEIDKPIQKIIAPHKKYQIIYADPAWRFSQGINRRSAIREKHGTNEELSLQYPTMADDEIINLNVGSIADDNCVLFLWTTDAHLEVAIKALSNWGFKYKTIAFTWNKKRGFMGKWTVKQCEICLLATKGTAHKLLQSFKEKSYLEEEKTKHSKKPNEFRLRIERMFGDIPKVELFAREKHNGWDAWGNEVKNNIEL